MICLGEGVLFAIMGPTYCVLNTLLSWLELIVGSLVPFAIILSCNSVCLITLNLNYGRQKLMTGNTSTSQVPAMTAMLLLVSFAFIILTMPTTIFHIYYNVASVYDEVALADWFVILQRVGVIALMMNSSTNFCLYAVGGSKFRQELFMMIMCRK